MFTIRNEAHMIDAVKKLALYMSTYDTQFEYEKYNARVFVSDVLYGLGLSIDNVKYRYADGFTSFKQDLAVYIGEQDSFKTIDTLLDRVEELEAQITELRANGSLT
jgi:hypothetical protein